VVVDRLPLVRQPCSVPSVSDFFCAAICRLRAA
jgi:hypothetical protein